MQIFFVIDLETDTFSASQILQQQNKNLTHSVNKIYWS